MCAATSKRRRAASLRPPIGPRFAPCSTPSVWRRRSVSWRAISPRTSVRLESRCTVSSRSCGAWRRASERRGMALDARLMNELVIHGHFYQPPRENPWTGTIDREPKVFPFHDWNERIHHECYRSNAFARIFDGYARIERIVNNFDGISFNFGPTLLSWLEHYDPPAYRRILEADRASSLARGGHGNAIAQAYNHTILPLASARDRVTQVRWGMADFRRRFGREPEALWMPETACNDATLGTLIDEGLKYAILSP